MKCAACGKDMGFWAKLEGHSDSEVCKECKEQSRNSLQVLVQTASAAQAWKQQDAENWIARCELLARKYHIPESELAPPRFALLSNIFNLVVAQKEISEADCTFLSSLGKRFGYSPEIQDTTLQIMLRFTIQSLDHGDAPTTACTSLVLLKGEVCHWEEQAGLLVQRTKRQYVGGSGGVSIPLGHGVRIRLGAFKAVPIDKTIYDDRGSGILHVTNQRICLTGQQESVAIPYKKVINFSGFENGFEVHTSSAKKPGIFLVPHPELTVQLVSLASSPKAG